MGIFSFFSQMDRRADIMNDMAAKLGVNWSKVLSEHPEKAQEYRNAVMTCANCGREGDCLRWQDGHEASDHTPEFCLNKDMLEAMRPE